MPYLDLTSRLPFFLRSLALIPALFLLTSLNACGADHDPDTPWLTHLSYDGQAQKNALVVLLSVDFSDDDGDLGSGQLSPLINGQESGDKPLPLKSIFAESGLALDATQGRLQFGLEILMDLDPAYRPDPGSTFELGIKMQDAAGHESNHPSVYMRIDYHD